MKIKRSNSRPAPHELSDFLKDSAFRKLQKDVLKKFGIPMIAIDRKGETSESPSRQAGTAYMALIRSIAPDNVLTALRAPHVKQLIPGVKLLLYPLFHKKQMRGALVVGPMLDASPDKEAAKALSSKLGLSTEAVSELFESLPVISAETLRVVETFLEYVLEVITQGIAEKTDYAKQIQDISSVYKVVKSLNTTLSLNEVVSRVLDYSIQILDALNGAVMLLDDEGQSLNCVASHGFNEKIILHEIQPVGQGVAGKVFEMVQPALILKNQKDDAFRGDIPPDVSGICAPLKIMDKVFGVILIIGARNNRDFTAAEAEILDVIASSAAVAINNARLYEDLCKKVQEHATLLYVANAISSSLDPDKVLQEVLDKAIRLLDAQKGSLMLIEEESQELRIVNACGLPEEIVANTRIKVGEGISGRVASQGEPILLQKGVRVSGSHSDKNARELDSAISVPVRIKEKVIGVLNVRDHIQGNNFKQEHMALLQMLASQAAIAIENARLHRELKELFVGSVKALINAIEARDKYTKGHSIRVTHYSMKIAAALDMSPEEMENLQYAALLHDIGKINIKDDILLKPGKLTVEEREKIQEHPSLGATIMQPVKAFQRILPFLYFHHERFDGSGYTQRLKGIDIPIESRIIAVADSFDAMTSDRPYRKALSIGEAVKELEQNSGTQFDPEIVNVFVKLVECDKSCSPHCINDAQIV